MEFWPENPSQSALYAKFGTIPGRNCSHNYHDRHQAAHYPLYYAQQQDQGREPSYWAGLGPGSRAEGALDEYSTWMDPELPAPTSSHFPFILDRRTPQHPDRGEYPSHEARDREWKAAQRAAKECERGFLREAWQRRWEPCGPARYNREVAIKRSDSSYRELEAWAARYCHSLPRRRRLEAELRSTSQGLLESRTGTDQLRQSANVRESGVWDAGGRMQAPAYYLAQAASPDTSHPLDIKEKSCHQRRMFSQPPGYTAPPPYKGTPATHHCDTSWEQDAKRQTHWPQPTLRKEISEELQHKRKGERGDFTAPGGSRTCAELDGTKHRRQETEAAQVLGPVRAQTTAMHREHAFSLRQKQTMQDVSTSKQTSSKIIEGRKFRLNKKTGGMTVFCLVSRIAGVTDTPSLPLCIPQTNVQIAASEEVATVSQGGDDSQTNLADEVDFPVPEKSGTDGTNVKQSQTQACAQSDTRRDNPSDTEETGDLAPELQDLSESKSTSGRESKQPVSVKYPLWREPGFTSRAEAGISSASCLKLHSEDSRSDGPRSQEECAYAQPSDPGARTRDIQKHPESEGREGLWVIDTSCVVVKMELIPSPKKEHVHYLASQAEHGAPPNSQVTTADPKTDKPSTQRNDSDPTEKRAPGSESDISPLCVATSSVSETLEQRAQRILGIPLCDSISEQQPGQQRDAEPEPLPGNLRGAVGSVPEETAGEEQLQNHFQVGQTEDAVDHGTDANGTDVAGSQDQPCKQNDTDTQLETDLNTSEETETAEDDELGSTHGGGKPEQRLEGDQHFSSPKELSGSPGPTHPDLTVLSCPSGANEEDLAALGEAETPTFPHTLLERLASTEPSPASTPCTDHSPSLPPPPPPLHLIDESLEATSTIAQCKNEDEPSQLVQNTFNSEREDFAEERTSEKLGNDPSDDGAEGSSTTGEQQPSDTGPTHTLEQRSNENMQSPATDEQTQSPTVFLDMKTDPDNSQSEREEPCDNNEEQDASHAKEQCEAEEQSQADAGDDAAGCLAQNPSQADVADAQAEPSGPDCEAAAADAPSRSELPSASCPSHQTDSEPVSLNPDTAVPESALSADLDQIKEFPSAFRPDLPSDLPLSFAPVSQQEGESVFLDWPHKDEPQCPTSLWDAVNRIRKHTAPDSENEEEEVSELWDPESLGEGPGCCDEVEDRNSGKMGFDEVEQQEVSSEGSAEDVDVGQTQQDECHEEPRGRTDEDTLSCSSISSHSSGDTVIVADEAKVQETTPDPRTDSKTDTEPPTAEAARGRCGNSQDATDDEDDGGEQQNGRDTNVSAACPAEGECPTAEAVVAVVSARDEKQACEITKEQRNTPPIVPFDEQVSSQNILH